MPSENFQSSLPMFKFKNIGPIKNAELELGKLTIISGRNNTGKSYLVYTLYGFLKIWNRWRGLENHFSMLSQRAIAEPVPNLPDIHQLVKGAIKEGQNQLYVCNEDFNKHRKEIISVVTKDFSNKAFWEIFSSSPENFKRSSINVKISDGQNMPQREDDFCSIKYKGENLIISVKAHNNKSKKERRFLYLEVLYTYLRFLFPELSLTPFILSSERFGISLFYRELDFTKNQLVDMLQKMKEENKNDISPFLVIDKSTSRYAMPIKDNIDYTRSISDFHKEKSEIHDDKLFDDIKDMMDGYYKISGDQIKFKSKARKDRSFEVPLHLASSSARGLSDLYFFLRHIAKKNHLLIIDEPESHLDPSNQMMLARLLVRIVKSGLKVLITTHSDYLVKEVNNLIMLDKFSNNPKVPKKLGYKDSDHLNPNSVRAYIAEKDKLVKCAVDSFGIDMPVFDRAIDKINRVSNELSSRIREKEES